MKNAPGDSRQGDFQRATAACLNAHGYTVK